MNATADSWKLEQLRAKTDGELMALISRRLDAGLDCARMMMHPQSHDIWESAERLQAKAEEAYHDVRRLLPWVPVTKVGRGGLECRLEELREALDEFSIHAEFRMQTACS